MTSTAETQTTPTELAAQRQLRDEILIAALDRAKAEFSAISRGADDGENRRRAGWAAAEIDDVSVQLDGLPYGAAGNFLQDRTLLMDLATAAQAALAAGVTDLAKLDTARIALAKVVDAVAQHTSIGLGR